MKPTHFPLVLAVALVAACDKPPTTGNAQTQPSSGSEKEKKDGEKEKGKDKSKDAKNDKPGATKGKANIVFVLADDLAWNLVQYMPTVKKMQAKGTTFRKYFVTDSLCCPSRTSILTGKFPHDSHVFKNKGKDGGFEAYLANGNEKATYATALTSAGYATAMLGKYLNGYEPNKNEPQPGWTYWAVAGNGYPNFHYALNENGKLVEYGKKPEDYLTDVVGKLGAEFVKGAKKPFVIEIATFAPHAPYTSAPRDAELFPELKAPRTPAFNVAPEDKAPKWLKALPELTEKEIATIDVDFRKRAQAVQAVDAMIAKLQETVKAMGEEENTYFLFSSDNGYHMGEHRMRPGKQTAFETDINVPLIVVGPGVAEGKELDDIVMNVDLCPTFEEIAGASSEGVDGHSLMSLLTGEAKEWRTAALVEHKGPHKEPDDPDAPGPKGANPTTYEALRVAGAVYVEYADGEREYHDLATDPDELHNTYDALAKGEQTKLHEQLQALKDCHGAACWKPEPRK